MKTNIFRATVKKNLITQMRAYPISFMIGNFLSAFYTNLGAWFMYNCFFEGNISEDFKKYANTNDYMSYVIIGTIIYLFVVRTCLNVSRTLITELREGTLESLMLAPFDRGAYFGASMCLQTITTSLETVVIIIIGIPFGLRLNSVNPIQFAISFLLALYVFFGLSMILGGIMLYTRNTYITQNTLFTMIFLLCGITFPVEYLPKGLQVISNILPVTKAVELLRGSLIGEIDNTKFIQQSLILFVIGSIYLMVGFKEMKRIENRALENMEV